MARPLLVAIATGVASLLVTASAASGTASATENRLSGVDRFGTARAIATATFAEATIATLVSGRSFPDALSAAYLNGVTDSPLLLTEPDRLPDGLIDTLQALGVAGIQVVGGTDAVSDAVVDELRRLGYTVDRLAGNDRYETAKKVAELFPGETVGEFGAGRAAILASGTVFADALSAGPMSGGHNLPILLTEPGALNWSAAAALDSLDVEQVLVVGGTAAVDRAVIDELTSLGFAVRRIAGATRQATAEALARVAEGELGFAVDRVLLARSDDFADALAGGVRGGRNQSPILLTQSSSELGSHAATFIANNSSTIAVVDVLGGEIAVPGPVAAAAVAAARG